MLMSISVLASGCATVSSSFCDNARYFWFANEAELSQTPMSIKRQILDHNDKITELCK